MSRSPAGRRSTATSRPSPRSDLRRSELISLPLAALALLLVFGSLVAAAVPLVVGGAAVVVALAAIFIVASLTPMSIFVLNLATLLGLGLGVDYSLLMTSRFREELARRAGDGPDRVGRGRSRITVATAGRAVFFSGLTVLLGLLGLLLFEFMILRSVGHRRRDRRRPGGPRRADAAAGPALDRRARGSTASRSDASRAGSGTDGAVGAARAPGHGSPGRRARPDARAAAAPRLAVPARPVQRARRHHPAGRGAVARGVRPARSATFGEGEFAPLSLAVRTTGPATDAGNLAALYDYTRRLAADPRVTRVESLVDVDPRLTLRAVPAAVRRARAGRPTASSSGAGRDDQGRPDRVHDLHALRPERDEAPRARRSDLRIGRSRSRRRPGMTRARRRRRGRGRPTSSTEIGGRLPADRRCSSWCDLPRAVRAPALGGAAGQGAGHEPLSILASFGALVWIFQDGNLSALLGFQPLGFVETTQPVILFCVLFGLSMDYEVFLLTRMKEVWDRTGDNREAVARGLERSGRIVTSAALIVVLVAGSFAFADIVLIKALGLGLAIAVALDATVVRALLVPATMRLLGHWNWWCRPASSAGSRRLPVRSRGRGAVR